MLGDRFPRTSGRPRLAIDVEDAHDQRARLRVTTNMRLTYEGGWDTTGLALADLLELSDLEAELVALIARRGAATPAEASAGLGKPQAGVERALRSLAERGVVAARTVGGRSLYTARPAARRGSRLPEQLWRALAETEGPRRPRAPTRRSEPCTACAS